MMTECIATMLEYGCDDMTVCGNNCVSDGLIPSDAIILPVNNYGGNYLKASLEGKRGKGWSPRSASSR